MYARNLDTGQTEVLGLGDRPIYSASTGHLIYQSERNVYNLWARPFSPETLQFTGSAFPLRENARQPSLSEDGTLAYLDGTSATGARTLVWRDRSGALLETIGQPQPGMAHPALSPDGQRVAVHSTQNGNIDVWVHDLVRSTNTRLTFDPGADIRPTWSPSGADIAYRFAGTDGTSLRRKTADGTGEAVVLAESEGNPYNPDWSRDGRFLVYYEITSEGQRDIRYVVLGADGDASEPTTFLSTATTNERSPTLSPDGRFLAYLSDESGGNEIYVQPFPDGAGKWQVSVNGGRQPRWSRDGTELYYVEASTLMAVAVSTEREFAQGQPQRLFESADLLANNAAMTYDVSADGQRFLTITPVGDADEEATPHKIRVVENWYEEFRDRER
jgi:serine/threonine-protein kinase